MKRDKIVEVDLEVVYNGEVQELVTAAQEPDDDEKERIIVELGKKEKFCDNDARTDS